MTNKDPDNIVWRVIDYVGGQKRLAKLCGVTQGAVQKWTIMRKIPAQRVKFINELTGIAKAKLNPDVFG